MCVCVLPVDVLMLQVAILWYITPEIVIYQRTQPTLASFLVKHECALQLQCFQSRTIRIYYLIILY